VGSGELIGKGSRTDASGVVVLVNVSLFDHVVSSRDDSDSVRDNDESEVLGFL
jgi:hypothetical protein